MPPPSPTPLSGDRPLLYFDFVDPASHRVSRMIDRAGAATAIAWRGFELRPPPLPLIDPTATDWIARGTPGAPSPSLVPWTRKAHELCEFARERGCLHPLRRALFRAHFGERTDIGRIDRLVEIAREAGLDRSETRAALDVDRYAETVLRERGRALRRGVADVPALVWREGRLEGPAEVCQIERAIEGLVANMQVDERQE